MMDGAPYSRSDNTDFVQELPGEILPKTIPPEVCIDNGSTPLPDNDMADNTKQTNVTIPNNPYDGINFIERHPVIKGADGVVKFDQVVSFPDFFSEQSVKVVASKYLCNNAKRKETDLRDMIDRVSDTTAALAKKDGYVDDEKSFSNKLKYYQIHQYSTFNSPVYFNQGIAEKNQLSACFILSVEDNMESIANLYKDEMMVFKKGSGSGVNFSPLRSSFEKVGKADKSSASGPISFLKASDTSASVVKSGGILRRAAKMACLNADHPDIFKFINCKKKEEDKLNAIKAAGILPEASYELSDEVFFQSSNLSVRFSNKFMEAVESDEYWSTREVLTGDIVETVKARDLLMQVSEIAHKTGDPGVMFHDTINDWNTTPADGTINASNPCVVGDTLLRSPEGDIKIRDLVESGRTEIPVYCCDPATGNRYIRTGRNPRKTGIKKPVYKVTFELMLGNTDFIISTLNHNYLDNDGSEIICEDIDINNTNLFPFNSDNSGGCKVVSIEYAGEEDVYNITVDEFHTVAWGEIITKNCGEYNGQDNTSCNLAALNLIKFFKLENGRFVFDYDRYYDVVSTMIIAQDVFVDNASYPTEKLTQGTKRFRALGFGPANLGGLLLYLGIPYDSDKGRIIASLLTSIITGIGHITSAEIAKKLGPGEWWDNDVNKDAIYRILNKHKRYTDELPVNKFDDELIVTLYEKAVSIWNEICKEKRPLRCSQISLAMPNGTTGFLMGSSGFGIEPLYSNVIYKTLSGSDGAVIKMVNDDIRVSLQNLGYADDIIIKIISEIVDEDIPFEKSKYLKSEHVAIFDTAAVPENGTRYISADGHIGMLQAIQPFISGGISKTINLPNTTTVEDIYNIYLDCWRKGLKSVTVYRDGSKTEQIMSTKKAVDLTSNIEPTQLAMSVRKKMPSKRSAEINKFTIHGVEGKLDGYITRGLYPNGDLGEVFIELAKDGSTVKGLVGAVVTLTSISLQYGVPLVELVEKMIYRRFEPSGWVKGDEHIRQCSSIVDYIFRHLAHNHLSEDDLIKLGLKRPSGNNDDVAPSINNTIPDLSFCPVCNTQLRKLGTCTWCINCSWSDGSCS